LLPKERIGRTGLMMTMMMMRTLPFYDLLGGVKIPATSRKFTINEEIYWSTGQSLQ
jgi:hypothetical protein